jgi:hypothetical protein
MKKLALCAFVVLLASALAAGCGSSKKKKKKSSAQTTQSISIERSAAALKAPASVEAGLAEITVKNTGKKPGGAQLVRVTGNQTAEEVGKAGTAWGDKGKPLPDWLKLEGGVGNTKPGQSGKVTQNLAPGKYYALDIESNKSAPLEVTGSGGGSQPSAGPSVEAVDYSFKATGLKTGKQTVLFDNKGKQPHFMVALPINPGKTIADVRKVAASEGEPKGPPPFDEKAGVDTAVLDGGGKQAVQLDLKKKGKYALMCFIPDRQGGPPHVAKGMVSEATVE